MKNNRILGLAFVLMLTVDAVAEIYKYVDQSGVTVYVNDKNKIPEEYQSQTTSYSGRYDHLSPSEKSALLKKEKEEREKQETNPIQKAVDPLNDKIRQSSLEEQKAAQAVLKQTLSPSGTWTQKITVSGNRVFVPVFLNYRGIQIQGQFLLDTGASVTLVYREVLQGLGVDWSQTMKSTGTVAGGKKISSDLLELDSLQVGPFVKTGLKIHVTDHEGSITQEQGLLGMDFLRDHTYKMDLQQEQIEWAN